MKSHIDGAGDQTGMRLDQEGANAKMETGFDDGRVELALDPRSAFAAIALERIDCRARPFPYVGPVGSGLPCSNSG